MEETSKAEEKKEIHPVQTKPIQQPCSETPRCPHDFGYLSQRPRGTEIPEECMMCDKIMDCILFKLHEDNTQG